MDVTLYTAKANLAWTSTIEPSGVPKKFFVLLKTAKQTKTKMPKVSSYVPLDGPDTLYGKANPAWISAIE
jgi:hypothetical protein